MAVGGGGEGAIAGAVDEDRMVWVMEYGMRLWERRARVRSCFHAMARVWLAKRNGAERESGGFHSDSDFRVEIFRTKRRRFLSPLFPFYMLAIADGNVTFHLFFRPILTKIFLFF